MDKFELYILDIDELIIFYKKNLMGDVGKDYSSAQRTPYDKLDEFVNSSPENQCKVNLEEELRSSYRLAISISDDKATQLGYELVRKKYACAKMIGMLRIIEKYYKNIKEKQTKIERQHNIYSGEEILKLKNDIIIFHEEWEKIRSLKLGYNFMEKLDPYHRPIALYEHYFNLRFDDRTETEKFNDSCLGSTIGFVFKLGLICGGGALIAQIVKACNDL